MSLKVIVDRLAWIDDEFEKLSQAQLMRFRTTRESPPVAGLVQVDGRQFINFGSNDYLGIAADEKLVLAVQNSVCQLGFGTGASPLVNGRGTIHRKLECELAKFENCEDALLFPTGFAANVGVICSLVGKQDIVFSDALNHASIIDGCRLSGAEIAIYPHRDVGELERMTRDANQFRRKLIVTDGLFSMDGDLAPLPELCEISRKSESMLLVDEAHATGVFGENGKGCSEHFEVSDEIDVVIGTLSKAVGSMGGFVAGRRNLIQYIFNRARPLIFSTAQPETVSAASLAALEIIKNQPNRRRDLRQNGDVMREKLIAAGFDVGDSESQIIPVVLGQNDDVIRISAELQNRGFFVPAIRPPSVPNGSARLRFSLSCMHSTAQITDAVNCLKSLQK